MERGASVQSETWTRLLPAICGAAAVAGLGEVFLGRLVAPGLSFDGDHRTFASFGSAAEVAGGRAAAAAAILVLTAAVVLAIARARHSSLLVATVAAGAGSSLMLLMVGGAAGNFGLMAVILVLFSLALRNARWAACLAALALLARQAPLAADAAAAPLGASHLSLVTALGELALLGVAPLLAIGLMRQAQPSRIEWTAAALAAALATLLLLASPTRLPMIAFGSLELAMAMPLPLYAFAAGSLGLLVTREVRGGGSPTRSIALAMLLVAAVQPLVLHHSIAGLIAVSLLIETRLGTSGIQHPAGATTRHSTSDRTAFAAATEKS